MRNLLSGSQFLVSFGHDQFARNQPSGYDDPVRLFGTEFYVTFFGYTVGPYGEDERTALLDDDGFSRNDGRIFHDVEQQPDSRKLSGQKDLMGIRQFGPYPESTRLGINLWRGEIDDTLFSVDRSVGQCNRYGGLPRTGGVELSEMDITSLAAEIVQCGQFEFDQYRVPFYDRSQQ